MIYNELLQSATRLSDYSLSSKCNLSHTGNVHREEPQVIQMPKEGNTHWNSGETSTAALPAVSQELSWAWDSISTHSSTAGPALQVTWLPQRGLCPSPGRSHLVALHFQFGWDKIGQRKKYGKKRRRLTRMRKVGGSAGKQEVRAGEEQRDLPYQRYFVRDEFLPAPLFQGRNWAKSCNTTRTHNPLISISHHLMLLSSGQKLEMTTLQPAPSLKVFLSFCLPKEHLVLKIHSLQAELFFFKSNLA